MATAEPPLRVLADPELFRQIASYLSGEPYVVVQYLAFVKHKRPADEREFYQHAVRCGDRDTLRSLRAHSRQPVYSQVTFSRCDAIMGFATALFAEQQSRKLLQRMYALVRSPAEQRLDMTFLNWLADTFTDERHRRCYYLHVYTIVKHGSVKLVQWVHDRQLACVVGLMGTAARFGRMDLVRFLHKRGAEGSCCTTSAMDHAASEGHCKIVKFLHENRSEGCTTAAMDGAASSGHLAILRFLHEHRSEGCSYTAMVFSAGRGHLACVRYLHEHNLPGFTADAMSYAGANGHLAVVKFLHENRSEGCASWTLLEASKRGHHTVVDFLCANRPMQNPEWLLQRAKDEHLGRLVASLERMQAATSSTTQWDLAHMPSLAGKVAVVTGANAGLGFTTALPLVRRGALVVLACRNEIRGQDAARRIREQLEQEDTDADSAGAAEFMLLDVGSLASVHAFAAAFTARFKCLDLLVLNAGVKAVKHAVTTDGFESQFGVNHLGHFALTALLFPALKRSVAARVVTVSSISHHGVDVDFANLSAAPPAYAAMDAYRKSKLCNMLFAYELGRRLQRAGIEHVLSVPCHPGVTESNLLPNLLETYDSAIVRSVIRFVHWLPWAQTNAMGALCILCAATDPSVRPGEYIGPHGFWEFYGYPRVVSPSKQSTSEETAARLWSESEKLAGVQFDVMK